MTDRSVIENVAHTLMTDLSVMGVHVYRSTGNSPSLSGTLRRVPTYTEISENLYAEAGWKTL